MAKWFTIRMISHSFNAYLSISIGVCTEKEKNDVPLNSGKQNALPEDLPDRAYAARTSALRYDANVYCFVSALYEYFVSVSVSSL